MQCVDAPAVPGGSGRGEARQCWLTSPHSSEKHLDWCKRAAPLALPGSDRGPTKSKEVGHLWVCRSEWNLGRHTHRNYRRDDKKKDEDGKSEGSLKQNIYSIFICTAVNELRVKTQGQRAKCGPC